MGFAPYRMFGQTRMVKITVYVNGKLVKDTDWDVELWVETRDDWKQLNTPELKDLRVRVIKREDWMEGFVYYEY